MAYLPFDASQMSRHRIHASTDRMNATPHRLNLTWRTVFPIAGRLNATAHRMNLAWRTVNPIAHRMHLAWRTVNAIAHRMNLGWGTVNPIAHHMNSTERGMNAIEPSRERRSSLPTIGVHVAIFRGVVDRSAKYER